ncbi:putative secreted protein with PEP-CTERM sorting signal [Diaminobutyricimonas aerilata]|uniref:Putative secreted protein with PEP-CTERM sorting signal n=1 Tax=Diaminobutyricimonas aerilata TaxID=1162967 RepID=A0A2M9CGB1_9MICO|nr:hypothetical protein [Diaminobutyricimonas aerilata]PJJ70885.1 putative secreted protein with PEP-CTERM sorting signal [Diaminobutyricimonas aerilata]
MNRRTTVVILFVASALFAASAVLAFASGDEFTATLNAIAALLFVVAAVLARRRQRDTRR